MSTQSVSWVTVDLKAGRRVAGEEGRATISEAASSLAALRFRGRSKKEIASHIYRLPYPLQII